MGRFSLATPALLAVLSGSCSGQRTVQDGGPDWNRPKLDGIIAVSELGLDSKARADGSGSPCDPSTISKFCRLSSDCDISQGMECLKTSGTTGICTCKCKPDDQKTPISEDSCPDAATGRNQCIVPIGGKVGYCMRTCKPRLGSNECPDKVACDPASAGVWNLSQPVCAFTGCGGAVDCPVSTSTVCSVAKKNCPAGETCLPLFSGIDEGRCHRPGKCDVASGLCDAHGLGKSTAKVGDPCQSDLDCAGNMRCLTEVDESKYLKKSGASCTKDSECCSRTCDPATKTCTKALCTVLRRHGYCSISGCEFADTLTIRSCPTGSACNLLFFAGLCQKTCDMTKPTDCRGVSGEYFGDYECRRWGNLSGYMKTNLPVCDFGTGVRCSFFSGSNFDCSVVGADPSGKTNPTNMRCRALDGKTLDKYDPFGFCLDDTSSGTALRSPLPVP